MVLDRHLLRHISELCRPECEGRLAGTLGESRAGDYLAGELAALDLEPAFGGSYEQPVGILATRLTSPATLTIGALKLQHRIDFGESWISSGGRHEGELVVAREGEGLSAPLEGKIVLIPDKPEGFDLEATVRGGLEAGIKGLLFEEGEPRWFGKSSSLLDGLGIPVLRIRKRVAAELASRAGSPVSIDLPFASFQARSRNLAGVLRSRAGTSRAIALTAHYDHIGDDPGGLRYPGALDNASGVATVLELARELRTRDHPFHVLVCLLTGEESGLLGAKALAKDPPFDLSGVINIDVLWFDPAFRQVRIGPVGDGNALVDVARQVLVDQGIEAKLLAGRDDAAAFRAKGIPTVGFGEYRLHGLGPAIHTPDDTPAAVHPQPLQAAMRIIHRILDLAPARFQ